MIGPIVDCSVTAAWFLKDERSAEADAVLDRITAVGGVAPWLWWAETRNVFLIAERNGRMTAADTRHGADGTTGLGNSPRSCPGRRHGPAARAIPPPHAVRCAVLGAGRSRRRPPRHAGPQARRRGQGGKRRGYGVNAAAPHSHAASTAFDQVQLETTEPKTREAGHPLLQLVPKRRTM